MSTIITSQIEIAGILATQRDINDVPDFNTTLISFPF